MLSACGGSSKTQVQIPTRPPTPPGTPAPLYTRQPGASAQPTGMLPATATFVTKGLSIEVKYVVTGNKGLKANATYTSSKLISTKKTITLPWTFSYKDTRKQSVPALDIVAKNGKGTITCKMYANGKLVAQDKASGQNAMLHCSPKSNLRPNAG